MTKERLLVRVRKLFALGASPNEHEAQSAILMAQKMLAAHGLSLRDVSPEEGAEAVGEGYFSHGKRKNHLWGGLAQVLARHFPFEVFWRRGERGEVGLIFVARAEDLPLVSEIFSSAQKAADKLGLAYARANQKEGLTAHHSKRIFIEGFIRGLAAGFAVQESQNPELAMVLCTPQVVADWLAERSLFVAPPPRAKSVYDNDAREAGKIQGALFARSNRGEKGLQQGERHHD